MNMFSCCLWPTLSPTSARFPNAQPLSIFLSYILSRLSDFLPLLSSWLPSEVSSLPLVLVVFSRKLVRSFLSPSPLLLPVV